MDPTCRSCSDYPCTCGRAIGVPFSAAVCASLGVEEGTFRGGGANALQEPSALAAARDAAAALGLLGEVTLSVQFVDKGRGVLLRGCKKSANVYHRGSSGLGSKLIFTCSAEATVKKSVWVDKCKTTVSQGALAGARMLGMIESQLTMREVDTYGNQRMLIGPTVEKGSLQVLRWIDDDDDDDDGADADADAPLLGGAGASGDETGLDKTPPRVVWLRHHVRRHTSSVEKTALLECTFFPHSDMPAKLCSAQWPVGKSSLPPTFVGGGCSFAAFTHGAFGFEQLNFYALNTERSKLEVIGGLRLCEGGGRDGISDVLIVRLGGSRRREVRVYVATKIGELQSFTIPPSIVSRWSKSATTPAESGPGTAEVDIRSPHLGKPLTEKEMIKLVKYAMATNGKFDKRFWLRETDSSSGLFSVWLSSSYTGDTDVSGKMWSAYCRADIYDTLAADLALADAPSVTDKAASGLDWRARVSVVAGLTSSFSFTPYHRLHGVLHLHDDESEVIIASHIDTKCKYERSDGGELVANEMKTLRVFAFRLPPAGSTDSAASAADDETAVAPLVEHELFVVSSEQFGRQELGFNRGKGYDISDFDIRVGNSSSTMDICFAVGGIDCWAMTLALSPRIGEETVGAEHEVVLRGLAASREAAVRVTLNGWIPSAPQGQAAVEAERSRCVI